MYIAPGHGHTTTWFKLYFNCFNYKNTYKKNIIYPGSDIKPEACTEVISWQPLGINSVGILKFLLFSSFRTSSRKIPFASLFYKIFLVLFHACM